MRLSDEKVIEFLSKSPVKSFPAMLDALRHLDGQSFSSEAEHELFDEPLGDNRAGEVTIRIPELGGISANALLNFLGHAQSFNIVRRRTRTEKQLGIEGEERVVYQLTASGSYVVKILEVLTDVTSQADSAEK